MEVNDFRKPAAVVYRRRSSFFNLEDCLVKNEKKKISLDLNYVKKLEDEKKEWAEQITHHNNKFRTYWRNKEQDIDNQYVTLSKEKKEYLDRAVNMTDFLNQHIELCKGIDIYLNLKQWYVEQHQFRTDDLEDNLIEARIRHSRNVKRKHLKMINSLNTEIQ